jgi:uncharacterized membrane protein YdbT with pleckstrin-like domain
MKKDLVHDEKIIHFAKITRRSKILRYAIILILLLSGVAVYLLDLNIPYGFTIPAGLGAVLLVVSEIQLYTHRLYITNHGVIERIGLLSRRVKTVDLEDIVDIVVTQKIRQRILNYGEIHVNTSEDKKFDEIVFPMVAKPMMVKKTIEEAMRRRGYLITYRQKAHERQSRPPHGQPAQEHHSGHPTPGHRGHGRRDHNPHDHGK